MHSTMPAMSTQSARPCRDLDSDLVLLTAFRDQGDRQALADLYRRHAASAYAVALRLTGEPAAAEDAVQDGLIALMTCVHQYRERPEASVRSWILALVANAARRRLRANRRRERRERVHGLTLSADPAGRDAHQEGLEAVERAHELRQALERLPEPMRVALLLRHADELSIRDIATTLGRKEKTVRSQIERGLEHLHLLLVRRGQNLAPAALLLSLGQGGAPRPGPSLLLRLETQAHASVPPATAAVMTAGAAVLMAVAGGLVLTILIVALVLRAAPAATAHPQVVAAPPTAVTTVPDLTQPGAMAAATSTPADATAGVPVSDAVLGRFLDADGHAIDGHPDPAGARLPRPWSAPLAALSPAPVAPWMTGIKALDFFAPIIRGGRIDLYGPAGVGRMVLIYELAERLRRTGGRTVLVGWDNQAGYGAELMADLRRLAVQPPGTVLIWQRQPVTQERARRAIDTAAIMASAFRDQRRDVLLVVFLDQRLPTVGADVAAVMGILPAGGSTTVLICHPLTQAPDRQALPSGTAARIVMGTGPEYAGDYPLIDPLASDSRWPGPDQAPILAQRQAARDALAALRARAQDVGAQAAAADPAFGRASRLHAYLTQPFFETVAFTGLPGTSATAPQTQAVIAKILAGAYDDLPVAAFRYIGASPR